MRHAFGKPCGKVARLSIGQVIMSVRVKDQHQAVAIEALRRAKFKFPGRQKILTSDKWGFTKWTREEFARGMLEGWLQNDGVMVKYISRHGPLHAKSIE